MNESDIVFQFTAHVENESSREFLEQFSDKVKEESCRGKVINIVSFVDSLLSDLLIRFSPNKEKASKLTSDLSGCLNTIMNKANICHMLSLLTDSEFEEIKLLANTRNEFAHKWLTADFNSPEMVKRLERFFSNSDLSPQSKFMEIAGRLVTQLYHRLEYAELLNEKLPDKNLVEKISKMAPKRL